MRTGFLLSIAMWAIIIVCALLAVNVASGEDGGPPEPLITCQTNITLNGSDNFTGSAANDCVNGGPGSNEMRGNGGTDRLSGGDGSDPLLGGDGGDALYGGQEGDHIEGNAAGDHLYTGCRGGCDQTGPVSFFNRLEGGDGNDYLAARNNRDDDVLYGGPGFDTCYVDRGDETHSCEDKRVG